MTTKRMVQGVGLVVALVFAYNMPNLQVGFQSWRAKRATAAAAEREFKQTHYSVLVVCFNCRESTEFWQDNGKITEGLEGACRACGVRLQVGPKGDQPYSKALGGPVEKKST